MVSYRTAFLCAGFVTMSAAVGAAADKTVTLNQSAPRVVYATVRGGASANTNFSSTLITRGADTTGNRQRALLKFDTQNTIPKGSTVKSALMTVTVKRGSAVESRHIGAYQVTTSWDEDEVTWNRRRTAETWGTAGGDLGSLLVEHHVGNDAGVKVTFDRTPLVKRAVPGSLGTSRYTRIALIDLNGASTDTTREFYTPDDATVSRRATLTVVYSDGTTATQSAPPPASSSSSSTTKLRVLHWNTHHGGVG